MSLLDWREDENNFRKDMNLCKGANSRPEGYRIPGLSPPKSTDDAFVAVQVCLVLEGAGIVSNRREALRGKGY